MFYDVDVFDCDGYVMVSSTVYFTFLTFFFFILFLSSLSLSCLRIWKENWIILFLYMFLTSISFFFVFIYLLIYVIFFVCLFFVFNQLFLFSYLVISTQPFCSFTFSIDSTILDWL